MIKMRDLLEDFSKNTSDNFKKGWIGKMVCREKDKKKFKVTDAKHYGSYSELILDNGITLTDQYKPWLTDDKMNRYNPC